MKCPYCHKNVKNITHFMKAHKALMCKKIAEGRRKGSKKTSAKKGKFCPTCGQKTV